MGKTVKLIISIIVPGVFFALFFWMLSPRANDYKHVPASGGLAVDSGIEKGAGEKNAGALKNQEGRPLLVPPLDRPEKRSGLKPFGIYVSPKDSPLPEERFTGFHTGVDLEVFEEELEQAVPVRAICRGEIAAALKVSGYGGVIVQRCVISGEEATVLYGHLDPGDFLFSPGQTADAGDIIGRLGADRSEQTDGERKHLHLGIHRGSGIEYRGYVGSEQELENWLDPCDLICKD